jgi:MFS family permease
MLPPVPRSHTSNWAIAALVLSLVTCLVGIGPVLAIVFGLIALHQIDRRPEELTGRGLAVAGIIIAAVSLLGTGLLAGSCLQTYWRVDPLVDNVLRSLDEGDAAGAMRDFHPRLAKALPKPEVADLSQTLRTRLGRYSKRHWGYTFNWNKVPGEPLVLLVVYRCRYTRSDETVRVTVGFMRHEGRHKISGLWFNAPELRDRPRKHGLEA